MDAKDLAHKDYMAGMKYKDIADKYNVSLNTVKSWKQRNGWNRKDGALSEKGCTQKEDGAHKRKKGGQPGNQNAAGAHAKGSAPPCGNKNAEKHGFFSKWLPEEAMEIMQEIEERSALDLLWDQIMIQYTAIIRAQKLMFVRDKEDKTVEIVSSSDMGTSWDIQQAWDKHEKFLSAQSRAMTALNGLIKQYEEMLHSADDAAERKERLRKLRLESTRIEAETERIKAEKGTGIGSVIFSGEGDLID